MVTVYGHLVQTDSFFWVHGELIKPIIGFESHWLQNKHVEDDVMAGSRWRFHGNCKGMDRCACRNFSRSLGI